MTTKKGKSKKKKWLILAAVVLVAGFIGSRFLMGSSAPRSLQAATAEVRPIETYIATKGRIAQGELREYYIGIETTVDKVYFSKGDVVKQGDTLVTFDHTQTLTNLSLAELAYEKTRLTIRDNEISYFNVIDELADLRYDLKEAEEQRDRYEKDYRATGDAEDRARWEKYFDMVESYENQIKAKETGIPTDEAIQILTLQLEEAKLDYETRKREVDNLPANIVAPFDGVIESLGVTDYGSVSKGVLACSVRRTENNVVSFDVGRYDFPYIELGQAVTITVGRNAYEGIVSKIGSVANMENNTVEIEVTVDEPDMYFIPGLEADLDVLIYEAEEYLTLPIEAVKADKDGRYCYVLTPSPEAEGVYIPVLTRVKAGRSSDQYIEITEGLEAGAVVVQAIPTDIMVIAQAVPVLV